MHSLTTAPIRVMRSNQEAECRPVKEQFCHQYLLWFCILFSCVSRFSKDIRIAMFKFLHVVAMIFVVLLFGVMMFLGELVHGYFSASHHASVIPGMFFAFGFTFGVFFFAVYFSRRD